MLACVVLGRVGVVVDCFTLLTQTSLIVTADVPVLFAMTLIDPGLVEKLRLVIVTCSVAVKENVNAPIKPIAIDRYDLLHKILSRTKSAMLLIAW